MTSNLELLFYQFARREKHNNYRHSERARRGKDARKSWLKKNMSVKKLVEPVKRRPEEGNAGEWKDNREGEGFFEESALGNLSGVERGSV